MPIAITRDVSSSLGDCQLSFVERSAIDVARAARQHAAYVRALETCGCRVIALPAEHAFPDAVFVEDVAIVLDEIAISTRPGAVSRRGEVESVAAALRPFRELRAIAPPGTIDGGDVLRIGRTIYVGQAARSNADGIRQLGELVAAQALGGQGYTVQAVPTRECLHLKSAVTEVADGVVLINPDWIDADAFAAFRRIEIDPDEPHAANGLRIGDRVVYPESFPRTRRRLEDAGVAVTAVDVSELQKAEGAVTCCSIVFRDVPPPQRPIA
jgi:dimethylargininase